MRAHTSSTPDDAKRVTMQVSTVGIVCNAVLTVFKLVAGIVAHSSAIVADAVHSASDILGSLIVMIGAVFSHKAADASHPYGHEKLECIASILLGNILVVVGAAIGYAGVMKIIRGETLAAPGVLALIAAVVSIVVKEGLYWYTIAAAKRIRSVSLKAEAWHHRSDALSSIGSFAGVLGARLGVPILDPIASIVICLFIFKVAYGIFRESIDRLVDRACDADTVAAMRKTMLRTPGVVRVDDLKTRLFGSRTYVDAEIAVDGALPLRDAHVIAEAVHHELERDYPDVKHSALHMPKKFFGAARNMREGGSLTILATALVDTGSRMDDVVFEEFKGTGNMELVLDRSLSERRIFPAIDLPKSSTRRDDLLLTQPEMEASMLMRRAMNSNKTEEAVESIIKMFLRTKNNNEFIEMIKKVKII